MPIDTSQARTVFISYARADKDLVLPVVHLLRAAGARVFIDVEDIPYGEEWESVLLERLHASERILVFWSANAVNSEWIRREYLIAIGAGLRVIPVPLDATPLPAELAVLQALTALVPLVYHAKRGFAPRRSWRSYAGVTAGQLFMLMVGLSMLWLESWPRSAEGSATGSISLPYVWLVGVAAMVGLSILLFIMQKAPPGERVRKNLQVAIYETVFCANPDLADA
jgi:hypothetical protein